MTASGVVGPVERQLVDRSRPHLFEPGHGRPIRTYEWTPRPSAPDAPLVVLSHGTGGSGRDLAWLAEPLAAAGLRVVSLDHHGNNHVDGYHPEGFLFGWERPRDVTFVLDTWAVESPVGVAGFSLGGYTAAALCGARLDPAVVEAVLAGAVEIPAIEELPDALDRLRAQIPATRWPAIADQAAADLTDARVRAAFLVAPGSGALLTPASLAAVGVPVAIRWGDQDTTNPFDVDVRPLLAHLPRVEGREVGPGVGHHDFIAPLTPGRHSVRASVAAEATTFFLEHLT